jgi:hypothetical protein
MLMKRVSTISKPTRCVVGFFVGLYLTAAASYSGLVSVFGIGIAFVACWFLYDPHLCFGFVLTTAMSRLLSHGPC